MQEYPGTYKNISARTGSDCIFWRGLIGDIARGGEEDMVGDGVISEMVLKEEHFGICSSLFAVISAIIYGTSPSLDATVCSFPFIGLCIWFWLVQNSHKSIRELQ